MDLFRMLHQPNAGTWHHWYHRHHLRLQSQADKCKKRSNILCFVTQTFKVIFYA